MLAYVKFAAPAELEALMHKPKKANAVLGGGKIEAQKRSMHNSGHPSD